MYLWFRLFNPNKFFFSIKHEVCAENSVFSSSSDQNNNSLNPWWVTGFCDGESSFSVLIRKSKNQKIGWSVEFCFQIDLHKKDLALLEEIKNYFGVGNIYVHRSQAIQYRVQSLKDIMIILNHFDTYTLITQKRVNYLLFKEIINLIINKDHLTMGGLKKILYLKAVLNEGLSDKLSEEFPDIVPALKPLIQSQEIRDPNWLAGFTSAEGCFFIKFQGSLSHKLKEKVNFSLIIAQHVKDEILMRSIINYLGCGSVQHPKGVDAVYFKVGNSSDINEKIIPFFNKYLIKGVKYLDYLDWCKGIELINNKNHLTKEGLEQLKEIKSRMNRGRD
jgi:hypothetical protein